MSDCILLSALLFIRIMNPCLLLMCKQIPAQLFMNLLNAWKFFLIVFEKLCQGQFFSRQVSIIQDHTGYQCIQFTDLKMQPYIFQLAEFPACVPKPRCIRRCQKDRSEQVLGGVAGVNFDISINTDPEAPINKIADYAITGDVNEIIPKMIKYYKQNSK